MHNAPKKSSLTTQSKSNAFSTASSVPAVQQSLCLSSIFGFGGFFSRRSSRVYCDNTEQQIQNGQILFNNKPLCSNIVNEQDIRMFESDNLGSYIDSNKMSGDTLPLSHADSMQKINDRSVNAPPTTPENLEKLKIGDDDWYQAVSSIPLDKFMTIDRFTPR